MFRSCSDATQTGVCQLSEGNCNAFTKTVLVLAVDARSPLPACVPNLTDHLWCSVSEDVCQAARVILASIAVKRDGTDVELIILVENSRSHGIIHVAEYAHAAEKLSDIS